MHRPSRREPELLPAWDSRWDDVTAIDELEIELTSSDLDTRLLHIQYDSDTLSPAAAAPVRTMKPVAHAGPNYAAWLAAFAIFLTGSSLVVSGTMFAGLVGYLLAGRDLEPIAKANLSDVTLAAATPMAPATPMYAPPVAAKKVPSKKASSKKAPVRRKSSTANTRKTAASTRNKDQGEEVVEMSISQLRSYLGSGSEAPVERVEASAAYARPAAAPAPIAAAPVYVPPAPVYVPPPAAPAPAPAAPVYRAPVAPPAAAPAPAKRQSNAGAKVVLYDGYAPLDPVTVTVRADSATQVFVDGQTMGSTPLTLRMEGGTHQVTLASAKGASAQFNVAAGEGDAWCFSTKGSTIKPANCKKLN